MKRNVLTAIIVLVAIFAIIGGGRVYNTISTLNKISHHKIVDTIFSSIVNKEKAVFNGREIPKSIALFYVLKIRCTKEDIESHKRKGGLYAWLSYQSWVPREFQEAVVSRLIDKGYDVNHVDETGYTALHHAIANYHMDNINFLLSKGAYAKISKEFIEEYIKRDGKDRSDIAKMVEKFKSEAGENDGN